MDVLVSALLLAAFVLFVDLTFGEGNHRASQLVGLFASGATLSWPSGVQEEDHPWLDAQRARSETATTFVVPAAPNYGGSWLGAAVEETDEAVTVQPVRAERVRLGRRGWRGTDRH